jgi:hypothetical protein
LFSLFAAVIVDTGGKSRDTVPFFGKHIGGSTNRTGNHRSAFENTDSQLEQIFKCRLESWQQTPINIISPCMTTSNQRRILKHFFILYLASG